MKIFAHRGNLHGPNPEHENKPEYLQKALDKGYCVEVDVWLKKDGLYLGHDDGVYPIRKEFLIDDRILVHAKHVEVFNYLIKFSNIHTFYQSSDDVCLTSFGYRLWNEDAYRTNIGPAGPEDILVDLTSEKIQEKDNPYGLITDLSNCFYENLNEKPFKLLVLDVDGVLTNGKKTYDKEHNVLSKEFCDRDFTAIKCFASSGVSTVLLSGDEFNLGMAEARKLPFENARHFSNQLDKSIAIEVISNRYKVALKDVAYVGDDYYDLSALNVVGHAYCPADAADIVKENAKVLNKKGGEGAIEALYELVKRKLNQRYPYE